MVDFKSRWQAKCFADGHMNQSSITLGSKPSGNESPDAAAPLQGEEIHQILVANIPDILWVADDLARSHRDTVLDWIPPVCGPGAPRECPQFEMI